MYPNQNYAQQGAGQRPPYPQQPQYGAGNLAQG